MIHVVDRVLLFSRNIPNWIEAVVGFRALASDDTLAVVRDGYLSLVHLERSHRHRMNRSLVIFPVVRAHLKMAASDPN
jgi:hypothetical protein